LFFRGADRSIDQPPSSGHLSHTVPQPSSDFLINVFQFCNVSQVANYPNVYLAKFENVQKIKVNKFLITLSFCRHLWHFFGEFLLNSEFMTEIFFRFFSQNGKNCKGV
jgi:hypothetical protein